MATLMDLIMEARRQTGTFTGPQLAQLLGCSLRTVRRHTSTGGLAYAADHHKLIRATYRVNPGLAAQYAAASGTSLEALGIAAPTDPTRPEHADSVVYAAADVLQLPPSAVRPAIAAAFAKAEELRVTMPGLVRHLAGAKAKPK